VARRQPDIDYTVQALARTEGSRFDQKQIGQRWPMTGLLDVERGCSGAGLMDAFENVGLAGYPVESSLGSASLLCLLAGRTPGSSRSLAQHDVSYEDCMSIAVSSTRQR
jgi:hypothetical protein